MLGHRPLTPEDYFTILERRWWVILIPAVILPFIGFAITYVVPPEYVSQALVLVMQQKVPESYVKPVVSEDLNSRLATMKEQILSRSRLAPIIERFNLYGGKGISMDDRIDMARKGIGIKPIQSDIARTGGLPGFFISFTAGDPRTAQLVCGEITSLFVSENLHARETSAEGTTDFLKGQLADAKSKLDEQAAKLTTFQQTYAGRLPGEEGTNSTMMGTLNSQLDATTQSLSRMEQDKSYMEAMLSQQVAQNTQAPDQRTSPQTQQLELQRLEDEESALTQRYTDDYPDVLAVRRKIKELQQQMAKAPAPSSAATTASNAASTTPTTAAPAAASSRTDSLGVQQLRAQLRALEMGITEKRHDQEKIQGELRVYQDRISSSPAVQEEYKNITRDTQTAQQFYDDLLAKMNQSKMATDLEKRQQGEQFTMMDEPNLPEEPTFPKRGVFVGGGIGAGLMLGLLAVVLLEYRNTSLRNERDIWAFTKLPTLAVIEFATEAEIAPKQKWKFGRRKPDMTAGSKPLMNVGG